MHTIPLGLYVPGNTVIHRLSPSFKFFFLIFYIFVSTIVVTDPLYAAGCVLFIAGLFVLARIPIRIAWSQLWPALPILIMLGIFQWWQRELSYALNLILIIFSALMVATLLTLTTTVEEMMDSFEKMLAPTARFNVPVETIVLAFSLTIRLIPLMLNTVNEVLDARKARGANFSIAAFGTPVIIRSIRRARAIGDALYARGAGD
ncbi:ABC-type transporter, permease component [Corynebacterium kutscheri]|uniref:ABC-type cobalt transport system, permease component CbiQ n=1 Tax=Corynebacterium kutscheri TaxID=35755 RepID=A0A0F6QZZ1_9CORY|nr:energy-coupling factor transporter transmembrane protein EcfT [Corynebacterium kutscheri]AKE41417.1 ABC-type cobalt transport system, permease component CbiQ [Corynebacterium kutscheri]VEH08694.1 ABC-type transporter, permease component [Corynebacterium kutscheri]VEH09741.1 ABC-type transporter, permease component [Corynebacterium kutscheri]VEH79824.1 ABC-type transporter, permease component [Corynebacterium kutscheri]